MQSVGIMNVCFFLLKIFLFHFLYTLAVDTISMYPNKRKNKEIFISGVVFHIIQTWATT